MASEEWVTQAQARQLPRDYGASPHEIEREIARDYRDATDQSAGHELGKAITDAPASAVEPAAVAAYGAANPPPESPVAEELTGALHDELADALDQARARLAAGDVPEVDRPARSPGRVVRGRTRGRRGDTRAASAGRRGSRAGRENRGMARC
jgi:hypothetical protein